LIHRVLYTVFTTVAWYRLPMADVSFPLGYRTVSVPTLPASNSNGSQQLNRCSPLTHSLTHQPTDSSPTNYPAYNILHGPHRKHCSIIAVQLSWKHALVCEAVTQQRLVYSCYFRSRCLAMGLHATILKLTYRKKFKQYCTRMITLI
jgi:hypothetical protein